MEAQLCETTSQLHELKLRQKQLEARNNLLEKVAVLNTQLSIQLPDDQSDSQVLSRLYCLQNMLDISPAHICTFAATW